MTSDQSASPFLQASGSARHAAFAELAERGPVQQVTLFTGVTVWLVTGYAEARELLAHPDVVKSGGEVPHSGTLPDHVLSAINSHMLSSNPPDHTRLRRLVGAAFTRRRVESMEPRIREICAGLLTDLAASGKDGSPVDLVSGFGYPLPITVITDLVGVPMRRRADFRRWSSVVANGAVHTAEEYAEAATAMVGHVNELIEQKRSDPADDLLSDLIAVQDADGDRLSLDELSSTVFILLSAGHETTVNLIVNGIYALLAHPQQLELLRSEPDRLPAAVEEILRYDGPLQVPIPSMTAAPVQVGDLTIPAGEVVVTALLPVNRDPGRFDEPDRFDITREPNPHVAFGHGIHHCVGAPLARLEGRIAIGMLLDRFPHLRLAEPSGEPTRNPSLLLNGFGELYVTALDRTGA